MTGRVASITEVLHFVARATGISIEEITGRSRSKTNACARHVAAYVLREHRHMSYPEIGKVLDRDHTTVMHSIESMEERHLKDDHVRSIYERVVSNIENATKTRS